MKTRTADAGSGRPPHARPNSHNRRRVVIAGLPIDALGEDEALDEIRALISRGRPGYMVVVNAAKAVAAASDPRLRKIILGADIVTADGMSVVWASRFLGTRLRERVAGIDIFERLVERAAAEGLSVYLLGAKSDSVREAVETFKTRHPDLRVAGYRDGYFTSGESEAVVRTLSACSPDLLFVAMGSPAQEIWIGENLLKTGARFALGVGGSFDHVSGRSRRAPLWMRRAGLEWLYRLAREPRRLWRRYLVGNARFLWLVVRQLGGGRNRNRIAR